MLQTFITQAEAVSCCVAEVKDMEAAIQYGVEQCVKQGGARSIPSGEEEKIVAAPQLSDADTLLLQQECEKYGIHFVREGLRFHLLGVDVGFTYGDWGISETGTVVIDCPGEDLRLATMIAETHVCVLKKSRIVADGFILKKQLKQMMQKTPNYTAFITGPSRTADIERVLAIGVHGPLEMHILLLEE